MLPLLKRDIRALPIKMRFLLLVSAEWTKLELCLFLLLKPTISPEEMPCSHNCPEFKSDILKTVCLIQ